MCWTVTDLLYLILPLTYPFFITDIIWFIFIKTFTLQNVQGIFNALMNTQPGQWIDLKVIFR